jgi:hypothetical protein
MRPAADRHWSEKCLKSASNGRETIRILKGLPEAEIPRTDSRGLEELQACFKRSKTQRVSSELRSLVPCLLIKIECLEGKGYVSYKIQNVSSKTNIFI